MDLRGQVGVVTKNPGPYGRLVQDVTRSPAFHVITHVGDDQVVSAETPHVLIRPASYFEGVLWTSVHYPTEAYRTAAVEFVLAQVGKPYAYVDIVLLFIAMELREKTPMVIQDRLQDTRQWFCSELGDVGLRVGGVNLFPGRPAAAVTPKDFLRVIKAGLT